GRACTALPGCGAAAPRPALTRAPLLRPRDPLLEGPCHGKEIRADGVRSRSCFRRTMWSHPGDQNAAHTQTVGAGDISGWRIAYHDDLPRWQRPGRQKGIKHSAIRFLPPHGGGRHDGIQERIKGETLAARLDEII